MKKLKRFGKGAVAGGVAEGVFVGDGDAGWNICDFQWTNRDRKRYK